MVTIIGGGISGLSLAYYLQLAGIEYLLLESASEPGGYIKTLKKDNLILELGPNSILCDEELIGLIKSLGIESELLPANQVSKARYIFKKGKYRQLPDNPIKLLFSNFFSASTKLKIIKEPFASSIEKKDESLEEFFTRRFGKEINDYALNPFITGIYAGDPKAILLEETFPKIKEYERKYGSVLKGFIKNKPGRRQTYNFKQGMQTLPFAFAKTLKNIRYNTQVNSISKSGNALEIKFESKGKSEVIKSDQVVITTPSFAIQNSLKDLYPDFSNWLNEIHYPPMCVVHTVYNKTSVGHPLNGFGGLNPKVENLFTSGSIWSSSVFSGRCPSDKVLFTSFIGGSLNAEKARLPEADIKEKVHVELSNNFNITGDPVFQHFFKCDKAIPQYTSHLKKTKEYIHEIEKDNIFFCVNWVNGVSLPDCIKKGKQLADKIIKLQTRY